MVINSQAIYGIRTKQPLVEVTIEDKKVMMSSADARKFALDLLDTAHAADGDAYLVKYARERVGLPMEGVAALLQDFRKHRIRKSGEQ